MSYLPFTLRLLILSTLVLLWDSVPTIVLAHHCGPSQPLPEFPRHSCRTHTQTWQPGETIDNHPGGASGRGSTPTQGTGSNQSLHCQLINNKCVCGSPGYTGRNIPCRPEATSQPQTPPVQPIACPTDEDTTAALGGLLPYAANQSPSDSPGNQPRPLGRGDLLRGQPSNSSLTPPCNWSEWMTNNGDKVPPGLRYVIWKAQNDEIKKPIYNSPNRFVTPGPNLPPNQKWKIWWATNNVSVTWKLRCFAKPTDTPLKSTCEVLEEPVFNNRNDPNWSYWLFLKSNVLPKVLPNDSKIPPWPMDPGRAPFPQGSQGPQYYQDNSGMTRYYLDLPYTFGLQIGQPTGRQPW